MVSNKFKQTEIGMIPIDWSFVKFDEVLNNGVKNGLYKPKEFHGSGIRIVNMKELFAYPRLSDQEMRSIELSESEKESHLLEKGDLLFARRSLVAEGAGKCSLVEDHETPLTFESSIIRARPNKSYANSEFIFYFFNSRFGKYYMRSIIRQVAVSGITGSDLKELRIPLPSLPEQKAIAKVLSDLDLKIELNQKMNKTIESIGQALFKHWFIDFEFPDEDGNPYKSSGGEVVYSEEMKKEIPKGWRVGTLEEVLSTLESGIRPKGGIDKYFEGIPSIGAENIIGLGKYDYSKTKYVPLDFFNLIKYGIIQDGDVLLYKDGAKLGRKSLFMEGFPFNKCCINEHVFILRTNRSISPIYLYFWLDQNWMTEEIRNLNSNSAQPGINKKGVNSLMILIPELEIINRFDKFFSPLIAKIFRNCLQNLTLYKIRDILLPKLMSGKIRVKVPETEATA